MVAHARLTMPSHSLFHDPPLTPPRPGREQRDHERYLLDTAASRGGLSALLPAGNRADTHAERRAPDRPRRPLLARALALVGVRS